VWAMARHVEELRFDSVRVPDLITGDGTPWRRPSWRRPLPL
jgi:hypothetical protein